MAPLIDMTANKYRFRYLNIEMIFYLYYTINRYFGPDQELMRFSIKVISRIFDRNIRNNLDSPEV